MAKPKKGEIEKIETARVPSPFEEMDRMFDSFLHRGWLRPWRFDWPELPALPQLRIPKVDVIDRDKEVVVRADLPGVAKEEIDIQVGENTVTIRGESRREVKEEKENYYRRELSYGGFSRTVGLPAAVDGDKAKAELKDGVLEVTLPKSESAKRHAVKVE